MNPFPASVAGFSDEANVASAGSGFFVMPMLNGCAELIAGC
jgi:hypothetical protein